MSYLDKSKWVLKNVHFNYFPGAIHFGVGASVNTTFVSYEFTNKVTYLWLSVMFLCWQFNFNIPLKWYGIRYVKND